MVQDLIFETEPVDEQANDGAQVTFLLDGEQYTAVRPADIYFERIIAAMAGAATNADKVHAVLQMLDNSVIETDRVRIEARFKDPADSLRSATQLIPLAFALCEHWGADISDWQAPAHLLADTAPAPANRAARRAAPAKPAAKPAAKRAPALKAAPKAARAR